MSKNRNPYKLQRVRAEEEPAPVKAVKPKPLFDVGDNVTTKFTSLYYDFKRPIVVLELLAADHMMSGWSVGVDTTNGVVRLDSGHFRKA